MIDLIKKAQRGDTEAFSELIHIYQDSFYRIARSRLYNDEDAADAIQEMLLTGWEKRETLKEPKYFKTWMIRILINKCNEILRKRRPEECLSYIPEPRTEIWRKTSCLRQCLRSLVNGTEWLWHYTTEMIIRSARSHRSLKYRRMR